MGRQVPRSTVPRTVAAPLGRPAHTRPVDVKAPTLPPLRRGLHHISGEVTMLRWLFAHDVEFFTATVTAYLLVSLYV